MTHFSYRMYVQNRLSEVMDMGEARSIMLLLFEKLFGLSVSDVLSGKADDLSEESRAVMLSCVERILKGEPVQYVLGCSDFMDMELEVNGCVLIPRPETEDLVRLCLSRHSADERLKILDIGTGSGCIALSMKKYFVNADVYGWDISADALELASHNAQCNGLDIYFEQHDILNVDKVDCQKKYDIIISNPPYVCESEKADMESHVLNHEPSTALFVPDNDALIFYNAIIGFALISLSPGGELYFETNRRYANEIARKMMQKGFDDVAVAKDQFGNDRMVVGKMGLTSIYKD